MWFSAVGYAQEQQLSAEELYERVVPSVWMVQVRTPDGSAVVIAPGALITNCHVVDKATQIAVRHGRGSTMPPFGTVTRPGTCANSAQRL